MTSNDSIQILVLEKDQAIEAAANKAIEEINMLLEVDDRRVRTSWRDIISKVKDKMDQVKDALSMTVTLKPVPVDVTTITEQLEKLSPLLESVENLTKIEVSVSVARTAKGELKVVFLTGGGEATGRTGLNFILSNPLSK